MAVRRFEELECWKSARILVRDVFVLTNSPSFNEHRDLRWQLQSAALSSMNNIAEGFDRYSRKEKALFFNYSTGSCSEVRSMLYVCSDLKLISPRQLDDLMQIAHKTQKLTLGFLRHLRKT